MQKWTVLTSLLLIIFPCLTHAAGGSLGHDQFLAFISNPNIAYLLMLIAVYGIFFELANPGLLLPGVLGIISMILAFYAFQLIPINYAGLALLLVGIILMIYEIYKSTYGVVGLAGLIAFVMGSVMLFDTTDPNYHITWVLIVMMSAITTIFFFMVGNIAIRSHKKNITIGHEGLIGSEGIVLSVMNDQIVVRVLGEIWEARSSATVTRGQEIKVTRVKGLTLQVEPIK